jgi:hypothetical protein
MGQLLADVPSGLGRTPPHNIKKRKFITSVLHCFAAVSSPKAKQTEISNKQIL